MSDIEGLSLFRSDEPFYRYRLLSEVRRRTLSGVVSIAAPLELGYAYDLLLSRRQLRLSCGLRLLKPPQNRIGICFRITKQHLSILLKE